MMIDPDMSMMDPAPDDPIGTAGTAELRREMDRLSLMQALHEFEVANARVVDLTQRLVGTGRELAVMRQQLTSLQREYEEMRLAHEEMQRSRAYKLAKKVWTLRQML